MSERLRERLGLLSEEFDGSLRSASPSGSRSPRRMSRSPRPHGANEPAIGVTRPFVRQSHPEIAAWPAPPPAHQLSCLSGNVRTPVGGPAPPSPVLRRAPSGPISPSPISPVSQHSRASSRHDIDNTSLLTVLKLSHVARESSRNTSRNNSPQPAGRETELKRKIQTLEETVAEYERQKYNVMGTFSEYRERVAERERKLEAEYSSKIIALSEEVLGAKKDFEARMKSFQALQDKFEREKEQALEKLRKEHQKEIQVLEQRFSDTQLLNLEHKYVLEIQRLEEERKSLRAEKERLGETFEMKLRRAQSLYETELTAAKMLYTKELEALRDHEEALKEELLARQDEFHDRLQELQLQSKRSREDLNSCKNEVTALEKKLQNKEKEVQALTKELDQVKTETNDNIRRLSAVTSEFTECKQKFQQQEEELRRKARLLTVVEAAKEKLESVISDLQIEVKALKNKVEFLEKERENLQSQSESQTQLQSSQVNALEAVLDSVTKEKENTKEHYESLLLKERQQAELREHAMKKEFSCKLNELEEQYTSLKEELEESARLDKDELRESSQIEIQALRTEKSILAAEIRVLTQKIEDEEQDDITEQLAKIVEDTSQLTRTLEEYRERITGKDAEIMTLRKQLEKEITHTEDRNRLLHENTQKELDEHKETHTETVRVLNAELDQFKSAFENEQEYGKEKSLKIKELEAQNKSLLNELEKAKEDALETAGKQELLDELDSKNKNIEHLEKEIAELNEKIANQQADQKTELEKTISNLEIDNSSKTDQIEKLHLRVNDMLEQMGSIKEELVKKNEEIKTITARTTQLLEKNNTQADESEAKLATISEEHEEELKKYQETIVEKEKEVSDKTERIDELETCLKEREVELTNMRNKLDEMTQQLNEETTVVLFDNSIQEKINEKEAAITEMSGKLESKDSEIARLQKEMSSQQQEAEKDNKEKERLLQELRMEKEQLEAEKAEQSRIEAEVGSVFQNDNEFEWKERVEDLENALQRKNELIQQLQERLTDESTSEPHIKKRMSITSHGVFQNFVSQMKDKREEASEKRTRKEAEKKAEKEKEKAEKAAKEAAKELAREKSPARAKSPSILTRFRDRSPAKSKLDNLETTPSSSSRNLLSPFDAEKRMERSSPSRPLFSKSSKKEGSSSEKRPAWKF
uniref:FAM184 domain-containing protein n=1 Tax=Caenorhabditis tropicalis TaxID=1561998 RepID=A0A1I7UQ31_9PELO